MRAVLVGCLTCLVLASQADAKGKMTLTLGDSSPAVAQRITVSLRMEFTVKPSASVRLVAVAPGASMYDMLSFVTQPPSASPRAQIPRDGFSFELARVAPHRWRAFVSFPRTGKWLLVVPNWGGSPGYAMPPPIVRQLRVSSR